jgi:hypothetical protein
MMNSRFAKFDDPALLGKILQLKKDGREDDARDLVYKILTEDTDLTVEWMTAEHKSCDELESMLGWYEELEEYLRCAAIKSIIDRVKDK